ncbi:PREDICTED: histone-lysine N-methyltransferase SETMAR-like [Cyphomyrmex costatus]|uniref:histone-lysine N-methyltransferase SETMAR-like n=1 Tax=Cyphomyrmex costatus TaxID=456900 RepID=UPI0008522339|nr:PREDICTED: histone-lysine N-methyltransferase SETMAR-like [Cyphomyrmex costatus]
MEEQEYRILIKGFFLMGKTSEQSLQLLDLCYPSASAPSRTTVYRWFSEFEMERPKEATNLEIVKQMHLIVLRDRKIKLRELAEAVSISKEQAGYILHDILGMKKLSTRWVSRFLNLGQKEIRVYYAKAGLALFQRHRADVYQRLVTLDETWVHYHTPESNRQSAEWLESHESRPKRPEDQCSTEKVMASVFWDTHGIIFIDYLQKGKIVTEEYYAALLDKLNDEIKKKRPHMAKKNVLLLLEASSPHMSLKARIKLDQLRFEMITYPSDCPDLNPSDYYLFPNLYRWLQGKRFRSDEEVIAEIEAYFEGLDVSYYRKGIEMLENRFTKCLALEGGYVEE